MTTMECPSQKTESARTTWQVLRARCTSFKMPLQVALVSGALLGVSLGLFVCVAGNYLTVLLRQAKDAYVVYRLSGERDELLATKDRLERELASLRADSEGIVSFQSTMKSRLDELHSVVEASTALGLFKRKDNQVQLAKAGDKSSGKESGKSELAALLDAPELTGRRARERRISQRDSLQQGRGAGRGVGGGEVECRKERSGRISCSSSGGRDTSKARKQDVSYEDVRASLSPMVAAVPDNPAWTNEQRELVERASRYAAILRALPIGAPVDGEITSGFGYRVSPFSHRSSFHEGIDLSLDSGGEVVAPGDGVVIKAEYDGAYGWMVDIAHTPELVTRYAHLTKLTVKKGQMVRRGQRIALSGSTGRSTGPHLHYEVRFRGRPRNPMPFIALADKLANVTAVALAEKEPKEPSVKG